MSRVVREIDFDTPGDWTPSGDLIISSGTLTLEDPFFKMVWGSRFWSPEPSYDPVTYDAILTANTIHMALDGGSPADPLTIADGVFAFWAKYTEAAIGSSDSLAAYVRYDDIGGDYMMARLRGYFASALKGQIFNSALQEMCTDIKWATEFGTGTWRQFLVWFVGDEIRFQMGTYRDVWHRALDLEDVGTLAFKVTDTTTPWVIASDTGDAGHPSDHPCPWVCARKYGACELKEASAITFPTGTTGLGTFSLNQGVEYKVDDGEPDPGTIEIFPVKCQFKIYHGAVWGSWTDMPTDGALSGEIVTGGDKMLVRFNDGSGYGLDNVLEPRYVPVVHKAYVSYDYTAPTIVSASRCRLPQGGPLRGEKE